MYASPGTGLRLGGTTGTIESVLSVKNEKWKLEVSRIVTDDPSCTLSGYAPALTSVFLLFLLSSFPPLFLINLISSPVIHLPFYFPLSFLSETRVIFLLNILFISHVLYLSFALLSFPILYFTVFRKCQRSHFLPTYIFSFVLVSLL